MTGVLQALFQPDDLYRGSRFERVVQTLSKLSHTSNAKVGWRQSRILIPLCGA